MNDDEKDELLKQGTRDYNEPGPVPRDAMWARIESERRGRTVAIAPSRTAKGWAWVASGLAAAIVLAAGIVIGRRLEREAVVHAPAVASVPGVAASPRDSLPVNPAQVAQGRPRDSIVTELRNETRDTQQRATRLAQGSAGDGLSTDSDKLAYRLVVLRHLAGTEAMITTFRTAARRGEVDAQLADWSRELLGTTRMLEASPVGQDPTMKRLLEDLDLVIVQIAQYVTTGKHNPDDLDLIEQSIKTRGVMTKLRSSLPSRTLPAGT